MQKPFAIEGLAKPDYCCHGGWQVGRLHSELEALPDKNIIDKIIYLDIGTNELPYITCDPSRLARDVVSLATSLLNRGAKFVTIGEILDRFGKARSLCRRLFFCGSESK